MAQTTDKKKVTFKSAVDFVYNLTSLIRTGFSGNVTIGPYASSVQVSEVKPKSTFPWKPVLVIGGIALAALIVLKD